MKNSILFVLLLLFIPLGTFIQAQKISDGETIDVNGMKISFNIANKESIQVVEKLLTVIKFLLP